MEIQKSDQIVFGLDLKTQNAKRIVEIAHQMPEELAFNRTQVRPKFVLFAKKGQFLVFFHIKLTFNYYLRLSLVIRSDI